MRILLTGVLILVMSSCVSAKSSDHPHVCGNNRQCVKVEIARQPQELARGLMNRDSLAPDSGMLFVFEKPAIYNFWMKNTRIPLDIIWLSADGVIVDMIVNAQPCPVDQACPLMRPRQQASYVLEINGGASKQYAFNMGDVLSIQQ